MERHFKNYERSKEVCIIGIYKFLVFSLECYEAAVEANPEDLQLKIDLAVQLQQANKAQDALALLYSVLKTELGFGDARKLMMDMMNALADGDPLKSEYRRKVYSLLY